RGLAELARESGAEVVAGSSLKAALDLDWDDPAERARALGLVLGALATVEGWLAEHPQAGTTAEAVGASLAIAHQVRAQDVEAPARAGDLLQSLAGAQRPLLPQDGLRPGLGTADYPLPRGGGHPLPARRRGPLPGRDLRRLPPAGPLHPQRPGPQRHHPSRRTA